MTTPFWLRDEPLTETDSADCLLPDTAVNSESGPTTKYFDVVIIGAGMSGISTAFHLANQRANQADPPSILVLERRHTVPAGATARNGGHLWPRASPHQLDIDEYGIDAANARVAFERQCIREMVELCADDGWAYDCHPELSFSGGIDLARFQEELDELKVDDERSTCAGLCGPCSRLYSSSSGLLADAPISDSLQCTCVCGACLRLLDTAPGISDILPKVASDGRFVGGLWQSNCGQIWPARFVRRLCAMARARGVAVVTGASVVSIESVGCLDREVAAIDVENSYRVQVEISSDPGTHAGSAIGESKRENRTRIGLRCRKIVHATNAWARELLPNATHNVLTPIRGQVIATAPLPLGYIPSSVLVNDSYEYAIQRRADGRLIVGGMRWVTPTREENQLDDSVVDPDVGRALREFIAETFLSDGQPLEVDAEWTGIMGFTPDDRPMIGPVPGMPGQFMLVGFCGHGMPVCFLAARAIAELIQTGRSEWLQRLPVFSPSRFVTTQG